MGREQAEVYAVLWREVRCLFIYALVLVSPSQRIPLCCAVLCRVVMCHVLIGGRDSERFACARGLL
jgi:hypothetical protein